MEGTMAQYPPGDPKMIDTIVHQLKSQGIFDQFRKECIADVDTKPAYQNLHQRVEGTVSGFLANQVWRPDMNKNLLRDSLRKHIHESGFLEMGVERIVDQVVNPKVLTVFVSQVEDVVYNFLGIEKPKKSQETQYSKPPPFSFNIDHSETKKEISFTDLLPRDLDPISPESDGTKRADNSTEEGELNDDRDDEQSPPFKPLRDINEHSGGSSLSGISGLTSPDSHHSAISFNGINKDRPITPHMSPIQATANDSQIVDGTINNHLLIHGEGTHNVKHPLQETDFKNESDQSKIPIELPNEETRKGFVVAEPESSDDEEDGSSSSSSRPSSSNSDSSSSSYSSSSGDSSDCSQLGVNEETGLRTEEDYTVKKNKQVDLKSVVAEEKPIKKEKRELTIKDEKLEKVTRDRKDDKQEKMDTKHESDAKLLKKVEQGEKEEKVIKKEEKEKKSVRSHEKDDNSTKKHEKEVSSIRTMERDEKLFSMFDQAETTVKRGTKEEKPNLKISKEERPIKKDEREEKPVRHSEKDNLHVKEEKLGKSPSKDPKDVVKQLKINDKEERLLHKNGDGKLSSKEGDINKKSAKKDVKEDKLTKTKVDDKIDKTMKRDDKCSKNFEKDVKSLKKDGQHKMDTDSSSQDSKAAESKNHSSHPGQKSLKPAEKERAKPSDKLVSKYEKSKLEDKSKLQDKSKPADRSKSADKSRRDDKYKFKNGSTDKERSTKQDGSSKSSSVKEKPLKHESEKQDVKTDPKSKLSSKHKDNKKEKGKLADDHGRHRDKRSDDRGSTDRDSNGARDRSSSSSRTPAPGSTREAGHRENKGGGGSSGKTGKGGNNDACSSDTDSSSSSGDDGDSPAGKKPKLGVDPLLPCKGEYICINNEGKLVLKIKKPKIAANIYEVRKIMQQRRSLAKLEKKRQREFRRAQGISSSDESPVKSNKKDETLSPQNVVQPAKIPKILQPAEIREILQPAEIPEIFQPAEIPEIVKPAKNPEILQPTKIPEIIQPTRISKVMKPAKIPEIIKPTKIAEVMKPAKIPEIMQPTKIAVVMKPKIPEIVHSTQIREVMKPAKIPEIVRPTKIVKICIQPVDVPEIKKPAKIPVVIQPAKIPEIVQPAKVPKIIKPAKIPEITRRVKVAEISTQSKTLQPSEIPLLTESLPLQSTPVVDVPTLIEKVAPEVHSPVKIALPVAVEPVETPFKDPEYLTPESDDDEPDLKYFESPEINEYDKLFLSHMKVLNESETLSELDVCSVHSDDLDDFSDSSFSLPEGGKKNSATKHGGTICFIEDLCKPVASASDTVKPSGRNGKQRQVEAGICESSRKNTADKPSVTPQISKNIKSIYAQKNIGLKSNQAKTINKTGSKTSGTLFNDGSGAESTIPVSIKSKVEFPKRLEDNASTIPTVRPQLPDDIENVSFLAKSPIPVGALSRHRVNIGSSRKTAGGNKTDLRLTKTKTKSPPQMRPPRVSPPPAEKRETRRSRKPNSKYSDGECTYTCTEPETKSLPVSPIMLKNQDISQKAVENLSKSEIYDIVVGTVSEEYGTHGINNNVQILHENCNDSSKKIILTSLNTKKDSDNNMEGEVLPFKDNVSLRIERIIPTPDSHTSGGSSSSGSFEMPNEQNPKLGPCRRLGLSRVKPAAKEVEQAKEVARVATPPGADFVMPLSPESDVSASSGDQTKKILADNNVLPAGVDVNLRQSSAVVTPASRGQRYSSDDLYKPRPLFNRLSRRTRAAAPGADDQAPDPTPEVAVNSATKRRAPSVTGPDTAPLPKRRR